MALLLSSSMHKMDDRQIYVVRANGCVVADTSNRWFRNGVDMTPRDAIVVPLDTERLPVLPLWQAVRRLSAKWHCSRLR